MLVCDIFQLCYSCQNINAFQAFWHPIYLHNTKLTIPTIFQDPILIKHQFSWRCSLFRNSLAIRLWLWIFIVIFCFGCSLCWCFLHEILWVSLTCLLLHSTFNYGQTNNILNIVITFSSSSRTFKREGVRCFRCQILLFPKCIGSSMFILGL